VGLKPVYRPGTEEARLPMPDRLAPPSLRPAAREEILTALAAAADLGMFFRLPDPAREGAGWQPVGLLYAARQDHLDGLLASVRAALHDCEPRVAASLFFQGYASRLLSPQLACLAANGCVPGMSAARLAWRHPDDQVIELGLSPDAGWAADGRRLMEQLVAVSFGEHLAPLADALRLRVRMSPGLLRGNAASALVSGLWLLSGRLGPRWRSLAAHALAQPDLRGTMRAGDPGFVRRSCCLYYRVPGGGLCADCPRPRRPA
jgi:ferric iron reductase protein FhuF